MEALNIMNKKCLGELIKYSTDTINKNLIKIENYISTDNMLQNKEGIGGLSSFPPSENVRKIDKGDILLSNIRPYLKKIYFNEQLGGCSSDVLVLRKITDEIDHKYLYYYLFQESFFDYFVNTSKGKGTKMPRGNKDAIIKFPVEFPSLKEQKSIVHKLSLIDKKIKINNEINKKIEDMAQALYYQWFVSFEFPNENGNPYKTNDGEMVKSKLGMIPKGWVVKRMEDACLKINSGGTPSKKESDYYGGNVLWSRTQELNDNFINDSEIKITEKGLKNSSAKIFPINSVLLAIYASPTVGRLGISGKELSFNQATCGFVADEGQYSFEMLYLYLKYKRKYFNSNASGTQQKNLSVGFLKELDIIIPTNNVLLNFKSIIEPAFKMIKNNQKENERLKKIRDTLLPYLMGGKLK